MTKGGSIWWREPELLFRQVSVGCVEVDCKVTMKRWSGGKREVWAHLDRVLKVGILGERRSGGKNASRSRLGTGKTHAWWPERLRQILGYLRGKFSLCVVCVI